MIQMSDKLVSLYAIDDMLSKLSGMYHIEDIRGMISRMPAAEIQYKKSMVDVKNLKIEISPSPNLRGCHEVALHFDFDGVNFTAVDTFKSEVSRNNSQQNVFDELSFAISRLLTRNLNIRETRYVL